MKQLFDALLAAMRHGERAALCTILGAIGSAPRGAGAKMAVFADGSTIGTVGGGAIEQKTAALAREAIAQNASGVHSFSLSNVQPEALGMICGGGVTIYIQVFSPDDATAHAVLEDVCAELRQNEAAWLIYELADGAVRQMGIYREAVGLRHIVLAPEVLSPLLTSQPVYRPGEIAYYAEPLVLPGTVYIFGGGHVGAALVAALHFVGFRVCVFDNREAFATPEHYPLADAVIFGNYQDISSKITLTKHDYVAIMTPGHQADREVLLQALQSPAVYIGCIGSRTKLAATRAWLAERGVGDEGWARVHAPIGIPLGGRTPEEIAVSITAELIRCRVEALKDGGCGDA